MRLSNSGCNGAAAPSIAALPGMRDRTATVFSCSKTHAMTGWRVGYVVAGAEITAQMQKLQENVVSCVNSAAQMGALAALTGSQDCVGTMVAEYDRRGRFLVFALNAIDGIHCPMLRGAFYAFPDIQSFGRPADEFAQWLVGRGGVVAVPGTAFGKRGEGHLRLSYAVTLPQLQGAVEGIERRTGSVRAGREATEIMRSGRTAHRGDAGQTQDVVRSLRPQCQPMGRFDDVVTE